MNERKQLLLVAYWYPPRLGIGGRRPAQLRKYLPRYGWDVTVLTARATADASPEPGVVATRYVDILGSVRGSAGRSGASTHQRLGIAVPTGTERKRSLRQGAISLAHQLCTFPDREVGWAPYALAALRELLREQRFDAVMTTSPPHSAAIVAAIGDRSVPWVADIRDLWTATDFIYRERPIRWIERRLEDWALRRASALVAVTNVAADHLAKRFPSVPVAALFNAFDPDDWTGIPFERNDRCTFLFGGSLYHMRGDPTRLFRAVRKLLDAGAFRENDLAIDIFSDQTATVAARADAERVVSVVRARDYVAHDRILSLERHADRLLLFPWEGRGSETAVNGKLFEYFGARRPVLAIGGGAQRALDDLLSETGAGVRCTNAGELESHILGAVREFKSGQSRTISADAVAPFDAPHFAQRYAALLNRVVQTQRSLIR